jgi:hypothetical protein
MARAAEKLGATLVEVGRGRPLELRGHRIGRLVGWSADGPLVDFAENIHGPLVARVAQPIDGDALRRAAAAPAGQEALLVFEGERSDRPILVALIAPVPVPEIDPEDPERVEPPLAAPKIEALVDGDRIVIEGRDEIVLRCGQASITLRRNGRVIVRGTYVETRSEGVNRIKGGTVKIN